MNSESPDKSFSPPQSSYLSTVFHVTKEKDATLAKCGQHGACSGPLNLESSDCSMASLGLFISAVP
jgi:hypothetical protein